MPGAHGFSLELDVVATKCPAEAGVQVAALASEKEPTGQGSGTTEPTGAYLPAGLGKHAVEPLAEANVPAWHAIGEVAFA